MRKISMFTAALFVIGVGAAAWAVTSTPRIAASPSNSIDPSQMQTRINAKDLPPARYYDYTDRLNQAVTF